MACLHHGQHQSTLHTRDKHGVDYGTTTTIPINAVPDVDLTLVWTVRCPEGLSDPVNDCIALSVPTAPSTPATTANRSTILSVLQGNDVIHFFDVQTGQSFIQVVHLKASTLCAAWPSLMSLWIPCRQCHRRQGGCDASCGHLAQQLSL